MMNNDVVVWGLLLVALISANLPFITNRLFLIKSAGQQGKSIGIRLLEVVILYFIVGGIGLLLEKRSYGQLHSQDWEFYAVTFFLFLVLAMPGFIYRHTYSK